MAVQPELTTTKPQLRLRSRQAPKTEFDLLVDEAIEITRQVIAKSTNQAYRLTAKAFEREMLEASGADAATKLRINKLQHDLDSNHAGLDHCRDSLRWIMNWLRNKNWTNVNKNLRRYDFLIAGNDGARSELSQRQLATTDLIVVATRYVAKRNPEAFGTCENSVAHAAELAKLKAKQEELFAQGNQAWTRQDLEFGPADLRTGLAPAWFRRSKQKVLTNPAENATKRLVDHIIATEKS